MRSPAIGSGLTLSLAALVVSSLAACSSLVGADFDYGGTQDDATKTGTGDDGGASTSPTVDAFEEPVAPDPSGACAANRKLCDGLCVSKADPAYGCGDGCDPCSVARGTAGCSAGACVIKACDAKRADCNALAGDGCETALVSNPAHCGACGNVCGAGLVCSNGSCASNCAGGETACGGACVDTNTSPDHCGGCGNACPAKPNAATTCEGGACGSVCNDGFRDCNGVCKTESTAACGATCAVCNAPANATATCTSGACGFNCNAGYMPDGAGGCMVDDPTQERVVVIDGYGAALQTNGQIVYFSATDSRVGRPPGAFRQVTAALRESVSPPVFRAGGVRTTGEGVSGGFIEATMFPGDALLMMSLSHLYECAIRVDKTVVCGGESYFGGTPAGTFRHLSLARSYACAVRTNGELACWGSHAGGGTVPPAGTFRQVSVGDIGGCAVRTDGSVRCWGSMGAPPAGTFLQVSVNHLMAIGLRTDGTLAAWGVLIPDLAPPPGTFRQVALGRYSACAIRTNGALVCWGEPLMYPQSGTFW